MCIIINCDQVPIPFVTQTNSGNHSCHYSCLVNVYTSHKMFKVTSVDMLRYAGGTYEGAPAHFSRTSEEFLNTTFLPRGSPKTNCILFSGSNLKDLSQ